MRFLLHRDHIWKDISIRVIFVSVILVSAVTPYIVGSMQTVSALSGSEFKAGHIIDDNVFFNKNDMSATQIQSFLNAKVPACDTYHARSSSQNDSGPPYICLKDYRQNTANIAPDSGLCGGYTGASNESAATIIYKVSQSCGISPRVILVMLQKEQSLVTDTWPWQIQYDKAMGAFCPDTAPCNPQYKGFFYQVYYGAHRFKHYAANQDSYNYKAGRNNIIYKHPGPWNAAANKYYGSACSVNGQIRYDGSCPTGTHGSAADIRYCGSSSIFIQNTATALLYIYTPYQPNQAALDNLYSTGDGCSSYGNRNFWRLFNDWFGSTTGPANYTWSIQAQRAFTDSSKTTEISSYSPDLKYKDRVYLSLTVKNNGNRVWDSSVRLGAFNPSNRLSAFCDQTWIACNRPTAMKESSVAPGQTATFEFWIRAPERSGEYKEYFNILREGDTWFPTTGLYYPIKVSPHQFYGSPLSETIFTNEARTNIVTRSNLNNDRRYLVEYKVKNIGDETWGSSVGNPIRLGTLNNQLSTLCDQTWIACNRPTAMKESSVAPGQTATFEFWIKTPFSQNGTVFNERYRLLIENSRWLEYPLLNTDFKMNTPRTSWSIISRQSYTSQIKDVASPTNSLDLNEERYLVVKAKNLSGSTWKNNGSNPLRIAVNSPRNGSSPVCHETWIACNRPTAMKESSVAPGQTATFEFWIRAKQADLDINENYILLSEASYWLGNAGLRYHYRVGN